MEEGYLDCLKVAQINVGSNRYLGVVGGLWVHGGGWIGATDVGIDFYGIHSWCGSHECVGEYDSLNTSFNDFPSAPLPPVISTFIILCYLTDYLKLALKLKIVRNHLFDLELYLQSF